MVLGATAAIAIGAGGFIVSSPTPSAAPTEAKNPFMQACMKSSATVAQQLKERSKNLGQEVQFSGGRIARYTFKRICSCGEKALRANLSERQKTRAGETFGLVAQARFTGFRNVDARKMSQRKLLRIMKAHKSRERDLERWMRISKGKLSNCRV